MYNIPPGGIDEVDYKRRYGENEDQTDLPGVDLNVKFDSIEIERDFVFYWNEIEV